MQPRALADKAAKRKAVDQATKAGAEGATSQTKEKPLVGDFPPHYGVSVDQWKAERKRRSERMERMTPQEQDEESAERKRQRERWENTTPKSPTK